MLRYSAASLAGGAALEAVKNSGWVVMEQLAAAVTKALKDELVDIFLGGGSKIIARVERFFKKVWAIIQRIIDAPLQLLKGVFEFIVNALSISIRQIYQLARNLFDLGNAAWDLFHAARSMSKEELIRKISETIIASGTLVIWDALDPVIESQLLPLIGPVAPYAAAAISAIGFGISSYYLQQFVPGIVDFLMNTRTGYHDALDAQREACLQIIMVKEQEFETVHVLGQLLKSSARLERETRSHIHTLTQHTSIERLDVRALLERKQ